MPLWVKANTLIDRTVRCSPIGCSGDGIDDDADGNTATSISKRYSHLFHPI